MDPVRIERQEVVSAHSGSYELISVYAMVNGAEQLVGVSRQPLKSAEPKPMLPWLDLVVSHCAPGDDVAVTVGRQVVDLYLRVDNRRNLPLGSVFDRIAKDSTTDPRTQSRIKHFAEGYLAAMGWTGKGRASKTAAAKIKATRYLRVRSTARPVTRLRARARRAAVTRIARGTPPASSDGPSSSDPPQLHLAAAGCAS